MTATLAIDHAECTDSALDGDFVLDLRVVQATTAVVVMMCDTSDGCGSTCSTSACSSVSNDPF